MVVRCSRCRVRKRRGQVRGGFARLVVVVLVRLFGLSAEPANGDHFQTGFAKLLLAVVPRQGELGRGRRMGLLEGECRELAGWAARVDERHFQAPAVETGRVEGMVAAQFHHHSVVLKSLPKRTNGKEGTGPETRASKGRWERESTKRGD